jgi:outer membrane protein assembly factor BamA
LVKRSKKLPEIIDMNSFNLGVSWSGQKTDNPVTPIKGTEWQLTIIAGRRNIKKSGDILAIQDTGFNYAGLYDTLQLKSYQYTISGQGSHYFKIGRLSTLKTTLQLGWYQAPAIFKNNLFQIGGFKTLRGFDEESIFASRFLIFSNEYRLLLGNNSYLSFFTDAAVTKFQTNLIEKKFQFISGGTGLLFETKAGLLNICYAIGKRNDVPFSWKNASKIHFGYINYF